jgi:hypothetical protein
MLYTSREKFKFTFSCCAPYSPSSRNNDSIFHTKSQIFFLEITGENFYEG